MKVATLTAMARNGLKTLKKAELNLHPTKVRLGSQQGKDIQRYRRHESEDAWKAKDASCMDAEEQRKILPGFLESHEQPGRHPLLLSDDSQAKMGFVKDMREGEVYLKDYDDYLEVYRAEGSGLKVVCVSNFPEGKDLVQKVMSNMAVKKDRSVSPHPVLVAHPATTMPEPDAVSAPTPDVPKLDVRCVA